MAYGPFIVGGTIPRIGDVVFTTVKDNSPAKRYKNTVWELVAQNRVPMGAGDGYEGGETIEAGLPNVEGYFGFIGSTSGAWAQPASGTGPFSTTGNGVASSASQYQNVSGSTISIAFSLAKGNPIYGASDTVQPPAYYFYFWRRVS